MTVSDRIRAVQVLQRFVRLSRMLLPDFSDLMSRDNLTSDEKLKIRKIKSVYESFRVNPELSIRLVNSNIFQLIHEVYHYSVQRKGQSPQSFYIYNEFLKESDRLIGIWDRQQLN